MTEAEAAAWIRGYDHAAREGWELAKYYRLHPPAGFDNKSDDWIAGFLHGLEHAYILENG
jgi:hypothetical protein